MSQSRAIIGDWIGSIFAVSGQRWDWVLSLASDGFYRRRITTSPGESRLDSGTWIFDENAETLKLSPKGGEEGISTWWVLDVTKCERANTLLVLRRCAVASRNLPILLYRVHNNPLDE
jgi:hypothetical protein